MPGPMRLAMAPLQLALPDAGPPPMVVQRRPRGREHAAEHAVSFELQAVPQRVPVAGQCFEVHTTNPNQARPNQGCGIRKCATTVRSRITGTAMTAHRDMPPSHGFALGRSNSPTMRVASSMERMPTLISDARIGNTCGGHADGRLAAQAQPGRSGCAIHSTNKPRRTTQAATTGERVAPGVLMGMSQD
jgi:hypothetical protein